MKQCHSCHQLLSESITTCPGCGSKQMSGITHIDNYRILAIIHEGRSSILFKAVKEDEMTPVGIRLFTKESGVDEAIADRLKNELEKLKDLPSQYFVQHYEIKKSRMGLWYRVSEWVDGESWGSLFVSGDLNDERVMINLFYKIASILQLLHQNGHFMPYLILEDIILPRDRHDGVNVKINYKLSRFLDPNATHHGPMLEHLISNHPDIINDRALDFKTDIWSLGKIFVELLTTDINTTDYFSKIDQLDIDPEFATLLKVMLSNDPDLRPRTMAKVVQALSRILGKSRTKHEPQPIHKKKSLIKEVRWLKKIVVVLVIFILGIFAFNGISWLYMKSDKDRQEAAFSKFVEHYARSIAFLMVEYWLQDDSTIVYKKKVEGTAFLVDPQGYLLTNRHVACPWLEDTSLYQVFSQFSLLEKKLTFNYRMFLWFEGEKAFNRLVALSDSEDISDIYHLSSAYSTDPPSNLKIIGVPRTSGNMGEQIKSPFKDDFAVLKISHPPGNLTPLPLAENMKPEDTPRLSPVIIIGFPLGQKTQINRVNASVTRGHVRRTSDEIIQVDSSIYKGNSGGPAVNEKGKVIGIASGVITDQSNPYLNILTPLSDFGLILPIDRAVAFVRDIKSGRIKWDGHLDFSLPEKIEKISDLALNCNWNKALDLSLKYMQSNASPLLIYSAAMLNFCREDYDESTRFFEQVISMEQDNNSSKLMLTIIDWLTHHKGSHVFTKELLSMDWRSDDEFLGYLATVLKNQSPILPDLIDWETKTEKSWRYFIDGLIQERQKDYDSAKKSYETSILASGSNDWVYFLSFSRLEQINEHLTRQLADNEKHSKHQNDIKCFKDSAKESRKEFSEKSEKIAELFYSFESEKKTFEEKHQTLLEIMALAPESRTLMARQAYFYATHSKWDDAQKVVEEFLSQPGRETSSRLSLGLLEGGIMNILGHHETARQSLNQFSSRIHDPWYQTIANGLIGHTGEAAFIDMAENDPQHLITMHTAMGLWAEGLDEKERAIHHYREALGSYLDDRLEYNFALGRILHLRQD